MTKVAIGVITVDAAVAAILFVGGISKLYSPSQLRRAIGELTTILCGHFKPPQMMEDPMTVVDRGYVHVSNEPDGTKTIKICAAVTDGQPEKVYAMYVQHPAVKIDRGVRLVDTGKGGYTDHIAEVFVDDIGSVHVSRVHSIA